MLSLLPLEKLDFNPSPNLMRALHDCLQLESGSQVGTHVSSFSKVCVSTLISPFIICPSSVLLLAEENIELPSKGSNILAISLMLS